MSRILTFNATVLDADPSCEPRVEMRIDDVPLLELIRNAEHPFASREGVPALAGNYGWPLLAPRLIRLLCGNQDAKPGANGVLLNCECGWASCWPLRVRVRVFDRLVTWQEFAQVKRASSWIYEPLEPLRFSRVQYFDEIDRLRESLARVLEAAERKRLGAHANAAAAECAL